MVSNYYCSNFLSKMYSCLSILKISSNFAPQIMENKKNIRALTKADLKKSFTEIGEKALRANQVYEWLWQKTAASFEEMTNLSVNLREQLNEQFFIHHITLDALLFSIVRTIKFAFNVGVGKV